MSKSNLFQANNLKIQLPVKRRSFIRVLAKSLNSYGNMEGFVDYNDAISVSYSNFIMRQGECRAICGHELFASSLLIQLIEGEKSIRFSGTISTEFSFTSSKLIMKQINNARSLYSDLNTIVEIEKFLSFSDLTAQAQLGYNLFTYSDFSRYSITKALFSDGPFIIIDNSLFACDNHFVQKVFDKIEIDRKHGKSFLLACYSIDQVNRIADAFIHYKIS